MPVVKTSKTLPGSDPQFHEVRRYMTPIIYKGQEILGYVASCRQSKCNWRATYANNEARAIGIHTHRGQAIHAARVDYFVAQGVTDPDRIEDAILDAADKYTHNLEAWKAAVNTIWCHYTDRPIEEVPEFNVNVKYHMAISARDMARQLIHAETIR